MIPCLALDMSEDLFWTLNPKRLHPYIEADKMKQEKRDTEMWRMGMYVQNAVAVAVDKVLNGRKSVLEYMDKPILTKYKESQGEVELTEDEKERQVEALFLSLETLSTNSKLGKKHKESEQCPTTTET